MALELSGTVIKDFGTITGQGRNGTWKNREFLIQTLEQYSKLLLVKVVGEKCETIPVYVNAQVTIGFTVSSREWNGRYFTECIAYRVDRYISETEKYQAKQQNHTPQTPSLFPDPNITPEEDPDLPF